MVALFGAVLALSICLGAFVFVEEAKRLINPNWHQDLPLRNDWFAQFGGDKRVCDLLQPSAWKDALFGLVYLSHYSYPAIYLAQLLLAGEQTAATRFITVFALFSAAYWLTLVYFPVSPPWFLARVDAPEADFVRFDALTGLRVFRRLYSRSKTVHGAFPSGHVAWTLLVLAQNDLRAHPSRQWSAWLTFSHAALMVTAAVYSRHHWVVDCLGSALYVLVCVRLCDAV